jgi:hypothetical protein
VKGKPIRILGTFISLKDHALSFFYNLLIVQLSLPSIAGQFFVFLLQPMVVYFLAARPLNLLFIFFGEQFNFLFRGGALLILFQGNTSGFLAFGATIIGLTTAC